MAGDEWPVVGARLRVRDTRYVDGAGQIARHPERNEVKPRDLRVLCKEQ